MKSGNINFLEPSEPLQACNGTALPIPSPLPLFVYVTRFMVVTQSVAANTDWNMTKKKLYC